MIFEFKIHQEYKMSGALISPFSHQIVFFVKLRDCKKKYMKSQITVISCVFSADFSLSLSLSPSVFLQYLLAFYCLRPPFSLAAALLSSGPLYQPFTHFFDYRIFKFSVSFSPLPLSPALKSFALLSCLLLILFENEMSYDVSNQSCISESFLFYMYSASCSCRIHLTAGTDRFSRCEYVMAYGWPISPLFLSLLFALCPLFTKVFFFSLSFTLFTHFRLYFMLFILRFKAIFSAFISFDLFRLLENIVVSVILQCGLCLHGMCHTAFPS